MATSSKVKFDLDTLRTKALESLDKRIELAEATLKSYVDPESQRQVERDWRAAQEKKISEVFSLLGGDDLSDYQLKKFRLDPFPESDSWDRRRAEEKLSSLQSRKSIIEAKVDSIVADEDGNVALTTTQLKDFFDL